MRSPVNRGTARDLLVTLSAITFVAVSGVIAMAFVAGGAKVDPATLAVLGCMTFALGAPRAARHRRTRHRRRLRRVVGDPAALAGVWRRSLAEAWTARDQYAAAVASDVSSPLWDRLADHLPVIDAALARCGVLARDGDLLARQLQGFHAKRLRRDLRSALWRDPDGLRTQHLEARLGEVERLEASVQQLQARLEVQVHDLRTAAWRATELRTRPAADADDGLSDMLADLTLLREALDEVDAQPRAAPDVDGDHGAAGAPTSAGGLRYDV